MNKPSSEKTTSVVVAFSGGLDTSFCLAYLKDQGYQVHTVTVDGGGFKSEELADIARLANKLGARSHSVVNGTAEIYQNFASYIIKGNILRGQVYPLCVGAERVVQARALVESAKKLGANAVCHGCTGAGNDQVRFDVEIRCQHPTIQIIAPIRELKLSREDELKYLAERGVEFPKDRKTYSINQGILGTTIGGGSAHDSWSSIPEEAYVLTTAPAKAPRDPLELTLRFESGLPVAINNNNLPGLEILLELNKLGAKYGIGRGVHLGDTTLGIKGRLAFEAPGALIAITSHRELEKLVHTKWQSYIKEQAVQLYAMLLHEGLWANPALRDVEALIDSSQKFVSGEVRVALHPGRVQVEGIRSSFSLMNSAATYGEGSSLWSGQEAEGFCKLYGLQTVLANARGRAC